MRNAYPAASDAEAVPDRWHLDRKVPIGIIFCIIFQSVSFTWFLGKQDARITIIEQSRIERIAGQKDRDDRQDRDNAQAFADVHQQLLNMDSKLDRLIERSAK